MKYKILVVDDEPDIVILLAKFLEKAGYEVESAANGREAFDKIKSWAPDLVISDVQMPVWDGFKLLKNLQDLPQSTPTPVLIVSGYVGGSEMELTHSRHFAGFIAKPFNIRRMIEVVDSFFKERSSVAPV
ncbi:response regulator [Bdellovibrio sp.]|uniref:response regulator n=1 Tax=Bdellovibrio sp. TaxID=28201 RepID=UPI0039E23771